VSKLRIHVHLCKHDSPSGLYKEGEYGSFFAGDVSEATLWLAGFSRKPLYAINVIPKEVTSGEETRNA